MADPAQLAKLEEIGGWVRAEEVAYHLGEQAVFDLFEAEAEGLVETRTEFTLTEAGQALIAEGAVVGG